MKLYYTEKSPYARLVRALAHGRSVTLECVNPGHPLHDPKALHDANPLGKIPCLELDDGTWLLDSRVCLAYLDTQGEGASSLPQSIAEHNLLALGYGLLDAAVNIVLETTREAPSEPYITRQLGKIERTLASLETQVAGIPTTANMAHVSIAVAYSYLSFRLPLFQERIAGPRYPKLEAWYQAMALLPCMMDTYPKD